VQTPLGKGVVREARNNGQLLIDIRGRFVVLEEHAVTRLEAARRPARKRKIESATSPESVVSGAGAATEVDLHGLTVDEALARADQAVNDALLADAVELRLIHGKSSDRIRTALHRRLRAIPTVRAFRIDPRNPGVTIVSL